MVAVIMFESDSDSTTDAAADKITNHLYRMNWCCPHSLQWVSLQGLRICLQADERLKALTFFRP